MSTKKPNRFIRGLQIMMGFDKAENITAPPPISTTTKILERLELEAKTSKGNPLPPDLPTERSSKPSSYDYNTITDLLGKRVKIISPKFNRTTIPTIRKLVMVNPDMGQSLDNYVTLGNTGHKIHFDRNVSDDYAAKMRNHITNKHKDWCPGAAGANGLVNKLFSQILIGGALSNEWVVNPQANGVESVILINPEEILATLNKRKTGFDFWQMVDYLPSNSSSIVGDSNAVKLNPYCYKYYALNGDGESPYGFPPYMTALDRICTQEKMNENIDNIVDMIGILGFVEILVAVNEQETDESDEAYREKVTQYLTQARDTMLAGMHTGVMAGVKDLHEIKFNSIAKDFEKVIELYKNNELQIASGLKQDATFLGRGDNTSESQISVIFMKMLSQLRNIQNIIKTNLEFGYALELRLAGFSFDYLTVEFDRSTLQDDLKFEQAREIKIRNEKELLILGVTSLAQFGNNLGFETTDQPQPRVPWEVIAGMKSSADQAEKDQKREKDKDASDRKVREKNKPQGKIKGN